MTVDNLINFTKIASTLAGAAFGIIALLKENKNKTGKITRWGKIALIGVFASTLLTLVLQSLESAKAKKDADQARLKADSMSQVLANIANVSSRTLKQQKINISKSQEISVRLLETYAELHQNTEKSKILLDGIKKTLKAQKLLDSEEVDSKRKILRQSYPVIPFLITYSKVCNMDDPLLAPYIKRIRMAFLAYEKQDQPNGVKKSEQAKLYGRLDSASAFLPNQNESAYQSLLQENTEFFFKADSLSFLPPVPPIRGMPRTGTKIVKFDQSEFRVSISRYPRLDNSSGFGEQDVTLDFEHGLIRKRVSYKIENDDDNSFPLSTIDLLNHFFSWSSDPWEPHWQIEYVSFQFSYQESKSNHFGFIQVDKNKKIIKITPKMVGLQNNF